MKKMIIILSALILAVAMPTLSARAEPLTGGWEIASAETVPMTEDAQAAFDKAMEKLLGVDYTAVALLGTQTVAGRNYCILCQKKVVAQQTEPVWALVYINEDLQGNTGILNVFELNLGEYAYPAV